MAIKSSTIASAARKTLSERGTLFPSIAITESAKAISVAIGIPRPDSVGVPRLKMR